MKSEYVVIGLILGLGGLVLFYGAVMNSNWLFAMRRSRLWVRLLGRTGAQIAFGMIGFAALFVGGFLAVGGLLNLDVGIPASRASAVRPTVVYSDSRAPATPSALGFFDGGIRYQNRVLYLSPPPPGYVSKGIGNLNHVMTYQQFAAHQGGTNWGDYPTGSMQTNDDILYLIANEPDFASGWVIIIARPFSARYVEHEFFDVVSPTDWKIGTLINRPTAE